MPSLSPQQTDVITWARTGRGSSFVEAVAGAGKTTTLIELLPETRGSVAFTAYNKKIAQEIEARVADKANPESENYDPRFVGLNNRLRVGTFHSFGYSAWRRVHGKVRLDEKAKLSRTEQHLGLVVDRDDRDSQKAKLASLVHKLISLAKQRALGLFGQIDDTKLWWDIIEHFDLAYEIEDETLLPQAIELAQRGLKYHREIAHEVIDFDDMIYMPVVSGVRMWENDWVLVDEAQDTNPARRALARKMLRNNGRAVFVGDRAQAIYGFTGADSDAIDQIVRDFRCSTLPLTVTFRCPKAVVAAAQEVVSHIQAHETAPEGEVSAIQARDLFEQAFHPTNDAILCRKTKPLVETAYGLIRRGVACHVEGRDIGMGLLKLANKWSVRTIDALRNKLAAFVERETEKLKAKGRETQAEALADRVETLLVLMDGCQTLEDLRQRILSMFQDADSEAKPTLTLSTVHKSKGREWDRVFVLGRNVWMPGPWARQEWQQVQENNLIYVAYTRAKQHLVLAHVEPEN